MPGPVFIVGPSRSGTELLRSILNRSDDIHICNETHYFDDLRPRLKQPDSRYDGEAGLRVAAYFDALRQDAYGFHRPSGTTGRAERADLFTSRRPDAAGDQHRTADQQFESHCRARSPHAHAVWGEKTPRHVFRLDDIRRAYPSARVIFCCRDPRGVVASYRDWQNRWFEGQELDDGLRRRIDVEDRRVKNSYSLLLQCLMWNGAVGAASAALKKHGPGFIHFLKFEEMLADPRRTIGKVCGWLDLPYSDAMLDVVVVNSSYDRAGAVTGISSEPGHRWASRLSQNEIGCIEAVTGDKMKTLGYRAGSTRIGYAYILRQWLQLPLHALRALLVNRHRIANLRQYVVSRFIRPPTSI